MIFIPMTIHPEIEDGDDAGNVTLYYNRHKIIQSNNFVRWDHSIWSGPSAYEQADIDQGNLILLGWSPNNPKSPAAIELFRSQKQELARSVVKISDKRKIRINAVKPLKSKTNK